MVNSFGQIDWCYSHDMIRVIKLQTRTMQFLLSTLKSYKIWSKVYNIYKI